MKPYSALLAELLSKELRALRTRNVLTQEAMAERLHISSRAYSDLERGKSCVSAATLMFLLPMLEATEQQALIQSFLARVQSLEDEDAA